MSHGGPVELHQHGDRRDEQRVVGERREELRRHDGVEAASSWRRLSYGIRSCGCWTTSRATAAGERRATRAWPWARSQPSARELGARRRRPRRPRPRRAGRSGARGRSRERTSAVSPRVRRACRATNGRSILSSSNGKRRRCASDVKPEPKSSIESCTPTPFRRVRIATERSASTIIELSAISSVTLAAGTPQVLDAPGRRAPGSSRSVSDARRTG